LVGRERLADRRGVCDRAFYDGDYALRAAAALAAFTETTPMRAISAGVADNNGDRLTARSTNIRSPSRPAPSARERLLVGDDV